MPSTERLMRQRSESQWAVHLLGRPFDVLEGTARGGHIETQRFTLVSFNPESGECSLHLHNMFKDKVSLPFKAIVHAYCNGSIVESYHAPVCWS